jgi:hypothetical protein
MPNQPSPDKEVLSFQVPRTLKRRLQILAKSRKETLSQLIVSILTNATINITLTPEDYQAIAKAVQKRHLHSIASRSQRKG